MRCRKAPSNEVKSESNIDNLAGRNVCHGSNPWRRECFSPDFSLRYARPFLLAGRYVRLGTLPEGGGRVPDPDFHHVATGLFSL